MLLNSYYMASGDSHPLPQRGRLSRPPLADVLRYRDYVDAAMAGLLARAEEADPTFGPLLELGLHHEQQHQELILTDIKHALSLNPLRPAYAPARSEEHTSELLSLIRISYAVFSLKKIQLRYVIILTRHTHNN